MASNLAKWRVERLQKSARERGRQASLRFFREHPARSTCARRAFAYEYDDDDVLSEAVIVALRGTHQTGRLYIEQLGLRGSPALADIIQKDPGERMCEALYELVIVGFESGSAACFEAITFVVNDGAVIPLGARVPQRAKRAPAF